MPAVYYYGKKNDFVGKTLFEVLANLRNFGVNRMLIKHEELLKNPGKRCYYVVKKVEPVMDAKLEEGAIYAERVFRGARVPGLVFVEEESWHNDWQLIPKHEEDVYRVKSEDLVEHGHPSTVAVLPRWMEVPPLMDVFLKRQFASRGGVISRPVKLNTQPIQIMMHYQFDRMNLPHQIHRIAEEGEQTESNLNKPLQKLLMDQFRPENTKTLKKSETPDSAGKPAGDQ